MEKTVVKIVALFVMLLSFNLYAIIPDVNEIKLPGSNYFWGEGKSDDRDQARERAMKELSANIATTISSSFENVIKESSLDAEVFMESVVSTYTAASFSYLQPIVDRDAYGNYIIFYYLHKDELEKEYKQRRNLIFDIYEAANEARASVNVSRALQYYYYSLILMNSIPDRTVEYKGQNLKSAVPFQIKRILDNVNVFYEGDKWDSESMRTVFLRFEFDSKPVQLLHFSYLERGSIYNNIVRDGKTACTLTGAATSYNSLDIEIEYRFSSEKDCIPIVAELWQGVNRPSFSNKHTVNFIISDTKTSEPENLETVQDETDSVLVKNEPTFEFASDKYSLNLINPSDCPVHPQIQADLIRFLDGFADGKFTSFANDGFLLNKLSDFYKHNQPKLYGNNFSFDINPTATGWEIRSIPVYCNYRSIATQSMEYLILDFDESGKLNDVNFNVFDELYKNYAQDTQACIEENQQRQVIVKFLERYRTAFMNRDMNTLQQIFADEAVIIVGRVVEKAQTEKRYEMEGTQQEIEYLQYTKEQYLERQQRIFNMQRDIHLGFNTFKIVKKSANEDVYSLSMRQQYKSSSYADEGHLFLLIDFVEGDPSIYVRSWQPGEWSDEDIVKMPDFRVLE